MATNLESNIACGQLPESTAQADAACRAYSLPAEGDSDRRDLTAALAPPDPRAPISDLPPADDSELDLAALHWVAHELRRFAYNLADPRPRRRSARAGGGSPEIVLSERWDLGDASCEAAGRLPAASAARRYAGELRSDRSVPGWLLGQQWSDAWASGLAAQALGAEADHDHQASRRQPTRSPSVAPVEICVPAPDAARPRSAWRAIGGLALAVAGTLWLLFSHAPVAEPDGGPAAQQAADQGSAVEIAPAKTDHTQEIEHLLRSRSYSAPAAQPVAAVKLPWPAPRSTHRYTPAGI